MSNPNDLSTKGPTKSSGRPQLALVGGDFRNEQGLRAELGPSYTYESFGLVLTLHPQSQPIHLRTYITALCTFAVMFATSHEPSRIWRVLPVQVLLACQVDCMPPTSAIRELVNGGSMPPETQHQAWIAASPGLAEGRVVMDPIPCKSHHSLTCPLAEGAFSKAPTHQYLAPAGLYRESSGRPH
ncbi:hypothetical protein PGTUg99_004609 [Puccinia graminis f. sp. tritici]|uniref:Uncharacterized protein n=1 Tax=Puccinia graminis f. sp. tritici TaxID=56615 RepID=A0A5B0S229_PUCGR|nr:hypothetical protein PGTUg99_004609 [Puccinia graminis f. sp. tritici]